MNALQHIVCIFLALLFFMTLACNAAAIPQRRDIVNKVSPENSERNGSHQGTKETGGCGGTGSPHCDPKLNGLPLTAVIVV
ncbi:hypothetical protein ACEPAI_8043 [Sanghuangporus weigelae]